MSGGLLVLTQIWRVVPPPRIDFFNINPLHTLRYRCSGIPKLVCVQDEL